MKVFFTSALVRLTGACVLLALCVPIAQSGTKNWRAFSSSERCFAVAGERQCYIVLRHGVDREKGRTAERWIGLLLTPDDFTETKMRRLAVHLFRKYPRPNQMHVFLYSDMQQESRSLPDAKDPVRDAALEKYPHGSMWRIGRNEIVRYSVPPHRNYTTIVVRGKDI